MKQFGLFFLNFVLLLVLFISCIKLKHDMTIQPVHVTVEIRLKIDKDLADFFGDIDKTSAVTETKNKEGNEK